MYWFRTAPPFPLLPWLAVALAWWAGGWLIAAHAFRLGPRERLFAGFGTGLAGYLWFSNLLGRWLAPDAAFIAAGLLVLAAGIAFAFPFKKPGFPPKPGFSSLTSLPPLLVALALGWVFLRISQGLGIFDEYVHLPLISTMGAGNIPPLHFINSNVNFAYHYGFHLFGASLMRLGGMYPWSAFDLSKAVLWGYTVMLSWMLGKRHIPQRYGGAAIALILVFAAGTRYLLLLAPVDMLDQVDRAIVFQDNGTTMGAPFSESLTLPWLADGGPPIPFPFAFLSGMAEPLILAHAGLNILNVTLFLLIWFLAGRQKRRAFPILTVIFSLWALTWETSYLLFLMGAVGTGIITIFSGAKRPLPLRERVPMVPMEIYALLLSVPVALVQGGLLTELARGLILGSGGAALGLGLRWPPVILSKHLGALGLFSLDQMLAALFELGPVILFTPWITRWGWRKFQGGEWIFGALILSSWAGFMIPIFTTYHSNRDLSRMIGYGISVWLLLLVIMLWDSDSGLPKPLKHTMVWGLGLMIASGLVLGGIALTAAPHTVLAYRFDKLDARTGRQLWDALPPGSEVFDAAGSRATTLTGRLTRTFDGDTPFGIRSDPVWVRLTESPTVDSLIENGYPFVYVDEKWWKSIPEESRASLSGPCVVLVSEYWDNAGVRFRRMLDLRGCGER